MNDTTRAVGRHFHVEVGYSTEHSRARRADGVLRVRTPCRAPVRDFAEDAAVSFSGDRRDGVVRVVRETERRAQLRGVDRSDRRGSRRAGGRMLRVRARAES